MTTSPSFAKFGFRFVCHLETGRQRQRGASLIAKTHRERVSNPNVNRIPTEGDNLINLRLATAAAAAATVCCSIRELSLPFGIAPVGQAMAPFTHSSSTLLCLTLPLSVLPLAEFAVSCCCSALLATCFWVSVFYLLLHFAGSLQLGPNAFSIQTNLTTTAATTTTETTTATAAAADAATAADNRNLVFCLVQSTVHSGRRRMQN